MASRTLAKWGISEPLADFSFRVNALGAHHCDRNSERENLGQAHIKSVDLNWQCMKQKLVKIGGC